VISRLLQQVGPAGLAALLLIACTATFYVAGLEPMESEAKSLQSAVHRARIPAAATRATAPAAQMSSFYRFFDQPVAAHERLAQLYVIARASGVELPSADYQALPTGTRLTRYQLKLPVVATYRQARTFMTNALNEIPVLSVDQASFRRVRPGDPRLEVNIVMTLHLLEP
jgi:hypothetical protein